MPFSKNWYQDCILIIAVVIGSTALLYLPFMTKSVHLLGLDVEEKGMSYIYQNYDGVLYVVPAKTWYNPQAIQDLRLELPLPLEYYAAHLPVYPLFIALFAPFVGYLHAMILVNILFTLLLALFLYYLLKHFEITKHPILLVIVFLFLPRFFIVRSVGAPESIFMFFVLTSVFFFEKKQYLLAGLLGAVAAATKTPGLLLFAAYAMVFLEEFLKKKTIRLRWLWIGLIPSGLLAVFYLYQVQYGNFFAYFNTGGVVPMPYPFSVFNVNARWVDSVWLEEIILYFFIYGYAVIQLKDSKFRSMYYFMLIFLIAATFVQHRDLSRYMLPLWPFAVIAYEKFFTSKRFLILLLFLLPAIYLYAVNFLTYSILPIADWQAFL